MGKFSESVDASLEWTSAVLFRPFKLKKWIILGFIAMMAGSMTTSSHFNFPSHFSDKSSKSSPSSCPTGIRKGDAHRPQTAGQFISQIKAKMSRHVRLIVIIAVLFLVLMVLTSWLMGRFHFVFLESIVLNDASIRTPFKTHKKIGESLFNFLLSFSFISLFVVLVIFYLCFMKLLATGAILHPESVGLKRILFACLPYVGWGILWILIAGTIRFVVNNFITIVMYRDGCGFLEAWSKTQSLIKNNFSATVKFFFLKLALSMCCGIGYGIFSMICILFLMMPLLIFGGIVYVSFNAIPLDFRLIAGVILIPLMVIVALIVGYGIMCLFLPFAVFLRTVSLKFMARLSSRYNLFIPLPA